MSHDPMHNILKTRQAIREETAKLPRWDGDNGHTMWSEPQQYTAGPAGWPVLVPPKAPAANQQQDLAGAVPDADTDHHDED